MALSLQRYMSPEIDSNMIQYLTDRIKKERQKSMEIVIADANADRLGDDLIVEILSWLPVKWLMQYKSVCKAWHAIISSPDFASKHLNNYYRNINGCYLRDFFVAQYLLDAYCLQSLVMLVDDTPKPRVLASEDMVEMPMYVSQMCGPCDGLYYLYYYHHTRRALWNPAINELRVLPPLEIKSAPFSHLPASEVCGLGFDRVTADYKLVVITKYRNKATDCEEPQSVAVYSLRNDSWKYCGDLLRVYKLDWSKSYNLINGWYYWVEWDYFYGTSPWSNAAIIGFNLATDEFEEIKLPDYTKPASHSIGIYDDSLALLCFHRDANILEIWTLKDGIWAVKLRAGPFSELWNPIGHWRDNKLFLESDTGGSRLAFFDPKTQDIKELSYGGSRLCDGIFVCGESLVSIKRNNSPDESKEFDSDLEPNGLLCREASETESDYGMHDLFCSESSETDLEYGIQELFRLEGISNLDGTYIA